MLIGKNFTELKSFIALEFGKNTLASRSKEVEKEMREAARNLDFERAMELRDIIFEMKSA